MKKTLILSKNEYKKYVKQEGVTGGNLVPIMTSSTGISGKVGVTATNSNNASTGAWRLFDGEIGTSNFFATDSGAMESTITISFGEDKTPSFYNVTARTGGTTIYNSAPKTITVQISNNNADWNTVDERNGLIWSSGEKKTFNISNPQRCSYIRFICKTDINRLMMDEISITGESFDGFEGWVVSSDFNDGMDSLSPLLDRRVETLEPLKMSSKSEVLLQNGKLFAKTIDLKKYMDIRKIEVK